MSKYEELKVKLRDWRLSLPSDNKEAMLLAANAIESLEGQLAESQDDNTKLRSAVSRMADENIEFKEQLSTVTAQRDLLGKILSCQVKLNESEACLVYQDCYEALASLKGE